MEAVFIEGGYTEIHGIYLGSDVLELDGDAESLRLPW
jgi:hypothetical protein